MTENEYPQSAWRCILASGSSWVSGAGPCTALLKRWPLFRFTKAQIEKKKKHTKILSAFQSTQPVSATKKQTKVDGLFGSGGPPKEDSAS